MMKSPDEIKKALIDAMETASWVVVGGDAHDLLDAVDQLHASCADALAYINDLEADHRTEYCENFFGECVELGKARKRIAELEAQVEALINVARDTEDTCNGGNEE